MVIHPLVQSKQRLPNQGFFQQRYHIQTALQLQQGGFSELRRLPNILVRQRDMAELLSRTQPCVVETFDSSFPRTGQFRFGLFTTFSPNPTAAR